MKMLNRMNMSRLYVIGIGYKPLEKKAQEIILNSEIILASNRLFEVFKGYEEFEAVKDKIKVINNVDETMEFIKSQISNFKSQIVLLASGDPLFFGIGRRAVREFGHDIVECHPDLSSIQLAFSRIKEAWDDAFLMSLHGGPDPEKRRRLPYEINDIPFLLQKHNKIAILTDKENNPTNIAKELLKPSAIPRFHDSALKIYICERLGYPDERVTEGTPEEIAKLTFKEPNVVIIVQRGPQKIEDFLGWEQSNRAAEQQEREEIFGLTEDEIHHSRGLITKDEVRAVTIHKLRLPQKGVFWDIGAGSGSVSIEVAKLNPQLQIFAIEKDKEQVENIKKNKVAFNAQNIKIIEGTAPDAIKSLPAPDRVFIGGSSGKLKEILNFISDIMKSGTMVINAAQLETLNEALSILKDRNFKIDVTQLNVSRMKAIGEGNYLSALNPVFVIRGERSRRGIQSKEDSL